MPSAVTSSPASRKPSSSIKLAEAVITMPSSGWVGVYSTVSAFFARLLPDSQVRPVTCSPSLRLRMAA